MRVKNLCESTELTTARDRQCSLHAVEQNSEGRRISHYWQPFGGGSGARKDVPRKSMGRSDRALLPEGPSSGLERLEKVF